MTTATTRANRTPPARTGTANGSGRSSPPTALPSLPSLTGLRWMAALLVFGLHVNNFGYFTGGAGSIVFWAFGAGATGVSFFFVLSGFVLTWSARPRDRALAFWRRRIARVYPVHLVTLAVALLMTYTLAHQGNPTPKQTLANALLLHSWWHPWWQTLNPVSWSLACEAFFYASFPLLILLLRRLGARGSIALGGLSVAAVVVLAWADAHHWLDQPVYSFPAARLPEFVLGAVTARLVLLGRWRGPGLEASLALAIMGYFFVPQVTPGFSATACTLAGFTLLIPAAAVADLQGLPSLWRHRRLVRLGELSFAFYMIHLLVLRAGTNLLGTKPHFGVLTGVGVTAVVFGLSLGLSWLLYEAVERPARRLLLRRRRAGDGSASRLESLPSSREAAAPARD
ncbi:peptidoglycan/LPS O-acetylase OafA/YrhL [Streptomyces griseochromogenes]|uniref:Macrolide O-acyltransferase n=1 Tax=Streptomyces griseochromogenes TaxID=68214 RepID=A0A1B1AXS2_9ACTN|nr:acyltransferase [Streptomyces griseochromogenes]ANP51320.1 macrolide O-acyltransferase [Streptomyces griseochromogenes]MBP2049980.1 peptidoglycan/LPS O-acetylase OafA/YrhL [Streptomyces griseochromogenes]